MSGAAASRGQPELADIFRACGDPLTGLSGQQRRVVAAITKCRTAALGGHVRKCELCGYSEISYNSCRDRHCPKCQGLERVRWQEARARDLLPVPYFHLVFTIPHSLHELFLAHPKVAYGLLSKTAAATVKEVAENPDHLGARTGMTAVLHTWTQTLLYHPHIHLIVPGGGLDPTGTSWIPARPDFFLPVRVLSEVFRGKLLDAIEKAVAKGEIDARIQDAPISRLLRRAARKKWVVYSKPPFAGPKRVLEYLGRYTHRIAIGNERIVSFTGDEVTFAWRDRADGNQRKLMTLPAREFRRRFLLHVLPAGLVRIRHYGFLANPVRRKRIDQCRKLLGEPPSEPGAPEAWDELLLRITGEDVLACPQCATGRLRLTEELQPIPAPGLRHAKGPSP